MKKIFTMIIAMLLVCTTVTASTNLPDAVTKMYNNYTCDYRITMSFESGDEIVALLGEMGALDEMEKYVDVKSLLESIFKEDTRMTMQIDMSEDFKRVEMGLVADSAKNITVNKNLNMDIKAKTGMWMRMDLAASQPVMELVYSHPFLNKYMVIDVFYGMDDYSKGQLLEILNSMFNKEFMNNMQDKSVETLKKYGEIKVYGGNCIIKIDNDAFTTMLDDLMKYFYDLTYESLEDKMNPDAEAGISMMPYEEFPIFKGMQILGEDGITINYSLAYGRITNMELDAEVDINLSKIVGDSWVYESEGILKFNLQCDAVMSNISKTKVDFPVLTTENSFVYDIYENYGYEDYEEYEQEYPYYFVGGYTAYLPVENGKIYVPLRETIEDAYDDTVDIAYNNGVITLTSEHFETIALTVGSDKVRIGGVTHVSDKVLKINNVTYVSADFFEKFFGWELENADYSLLDNDYYYSFWTRIY